MTIRYASLFSGIGGFELGIKAASERTGIKTECVFASEFDPESKAQDMNKQPARIIYNKNFGVFPDGDITKINAADVPECDLIVGGPPCQDYSLAGKRAGLCGAKGSMFHEFIRIVREKQPRCVLIENVKGLLSSNSGWDFARVLLELEDAGYSCEWEVRNTKAYLPQNRERVFIVGHLATGGRDRPEIFPIREGDKILDAKEPTVYCLDANYYKGVAQQARTMVLCDSGQGRKTQVRDVVAPLRANTGAGHNNLVVPDVARCLTGGGHSGGNHSDMTVLPTGIHGRIRRLTPIECERLMGFPDGFTAGVADTNRYRCIGNSVTVPVVAAIVEKILKVLSEEDNECTE